MPMRQIDELQAISDHVLTELERMRALEQEKRTVDPGSARFRVLSDEIELLAEQLRHVSTAETEVAEELAGEPGLPTIEDASAASARELRPDRAVAGGRASRKKGQQSNAARREPTRTRHLPGGHALPE